MIGKKLTEIFNQYLLSFNNNDEGYSRKKVMATFLLFTVVIIHVKWIWKTTDFSQLEAILGIDYGFIAVLLGLKAYENKIKG